MTVFILDFSTFKTTIILLIVFSIFTSSLENPLIIPFSLAQYLNQMENKGGGNEMFVSQKYRKHTYSVKIPR